MATPLRFNPLKSFALKNVGHVQPSGLIVVVGPNSSGKTQMLKDIQARVLGQARKPFACEYIELNNNENFDDLFDYLLESGYIKEKFDLHNQRMIEARQPALGFASTVGDWTVPINHLKSWHDQYNTESRADPSKTIKLLEHFGRFLLSSLFLDRRLTLTASVSSFDYQKQNPANELQALYMDCTFRENV
jgi:ABC-type phosphate/phosphonate transport system ATPase subunit